MKRFGDALISIAAGGGIAGLLGLVQQAPFSFLAWLLSAFLVFLLIKAVRNLGKHRILFWLVALAFSLRLLTGAGLFLALPAWGHDQAAANAGYIYLDAYERDVQAWELANSDHNLTAAFREQFQTDQYGGLLAFSAAIYRYISPGSHQPLLIVLFGAFVSTLGLIFLWSAIRKRWGHSTALLSGWIFVLYPESVLLGASQMREPFIIGLLGIAFWAVLEWPENRRKAAIAFLGAFAGLVLISSRVAVPALLVFAGWFWLLYLGMPASKRNRILLSVLLVAIAVGLTFYGYSWLSESAHWDAVLTERGSGIVQWVFKNLGDGVKYPFLTGYGLLQPLLPAAIIEPSVPLVTVMNTIRAVGWYAILPLLIYSIFIAISQFKQEDHRITVWLVFIVWVWILVASLRAGGDAWDNPRYRTHFLIWIVLLAAWSWNWARSIQSPWPVRWYVAEVLFLLPLTFWYIARYYRIWDSPNLFVILSLSFTISFLWLVSGWLWDRYGSRLRLIFAQR